MKNKLGDDRMRREYDFSRAVRLRYASKLSEPERRELLKRSAALDAEYWLAHALQRIQDLEALIVAYLTLALNRTPESAAEEATVLLEGRDVSKVASFTHELVSFGSVESSFPDSFKAVLSERAWLVHKGAVTLRSGKADAVAVATVVTRLEALAGQAAELTDEVRLNLRTRLGQAGLTSEEVQKRTAEVIHRWLAA